MGVRLYGEYKSTGKGESHNNFAVEIIDTAFGGESPVDFTQNGVIFNLNGETQNLHSRFASQTVSLGIINDNDPVTDFISAMATHDEERFFIRVSINGAVKYIGIITAEGQEWQDLDRDASPVYSIQAMDGMGRLDGINYANSGDGPYVGYATLDEIIFRCMEKVGTAEHYAGTFYAIMHDSIEDSQSVSGDPMSSQRVDQSIFYEIGQDTLTFNYMSCREVLSHIAVAYNLCLRYIGPYYVFGDPKLIEAGGPAYAYDSGGNYTGTITVGSAVEIDNLKNLDADRKGVSSFGVLAPLRRARITYDHGPQDVNLLHGVSYSGYNHYADPGPDGTMLDLGGITVNVSELVHLRFKGTLRINSQYYGGSDPGRWKNHRYWFKLKLKIVWDQGLGEHEMWWWRDVDNYDFYSTSFSNYSNPDWHQDSGQEEYDWMSEIIDERNADINLYKNIGFDTRPLVSAAVNRVYFGWEVVRVFDENENIVDINDNPIKCWWEFADLSLEAIEAGNLLKRPTKSVSEALGNDKNSAYLEESTIIGDGPSKTSLGRIQVLSGGEWKDSALWGGQKLHSKSVESIVSMRNAAKKKLLGGFYSLSAWMDSIVTYDGIEYVPLAIQYVSGQDEWTGEWLEIGSSGDGITVKEKRVLSKEKVPLPENPNKLPDDERLEDRELKIITGADEYVTTGTYTTIALRDPAKYDYLFRKGDVVNIIDPVIGGSNELTIALDVRKNDTTLTIESWTPDENFPPHSYIDLERLYELANRDIWVYQRNLNFTGTEWDIVNDGDFVIDSLLLPDEEEVTDQEYCVLVELHKAGQKLMYKVNISNDTEYHKGFFSEKLLDKITFYEACTGQPVEIKIKLINK